MRKAAGNPLGWSDRWGKFSIWFTFDEKLNLAKDVTDFPLRLQFSSDQRLFSDSCLGQGGWFPLIECSVVQDSERDVLMTTLGGHYVRLTKDPKKPEEYNSRNLQWWGILDRGGAFHVKGPNGWKLEFDEGRLQSATTPEGSDLKWIYKGKRVVKVVEKGVGDVLNADYFENGLLDRVHYNNIDVVKFDYGRYPVLAPILDKTAIVGVHPVLSRIETQAGYIGEINVTPDEQTGDYRFTLDEGEGNELFVTNWDAINGEIKRADGWVYKIGHLEQKNPYPRILRTDSVGRSESYYYNDANKVAEYLFSSGERRRLQRIGTPGPAYMNLHKVSSKGPDDSDWREVMKNYYDNLGVLRRKVIKGNTHAFAYHENGILESEAVTDSAGGVVRKLLYDVEGRLLKRFAKDGAEFVYERNPTSDEVKVRKKLLSGKVIMDEYVGGHLVERVLEDGDTVKKLK